MFFIYYTGKADQRYMGNIFMIPFLALWLASSEKYSLKLSIGDNIVKSTATLFLLFSLGFQVLGSIEAYVKDIRLPFSYTQELGKFINEEYPNTPIMGTIDYYVTPVSAFINRPVYIVGNQRKQSYMIRDSLIMQKKGFLFKDGIVNLINEYFKDEEKILYIHQEPLTREVNGKDEVIDKARVSANINIDFVYRLDDPKPIWEDEIYYVYEITIRH
jgi:hypothetical protein